ncbi:unnamed protein product [Somion occarium]|uniref:Non-specific serine/threonine protein kinase n=1 Tax=Somion occarium TaxID=3059160 RepID=A0ABP1CYE9_9APHY
MENTPQIMSAAELEMRAARVADPGIDLKTKYAVACEIRDMIDTVRDSESSHVVPHMVPVLLEILRSGEPSFQRDSLEFSFRRVLLEILHRIPTAEIVRTQAIPMYNGMLYLIRHDNEEIAITCCKTIVDIARAYRGITEEHVSEFLTIVLELYHNIPGLVEECFSEQSAVMDPNVVLPGTRSFKVIAEMIHVVVAFAQANRAVVLPMVQQNLPSFLAVLNLEAPAQKKAREEFEARGGLWAGMAPTIRNPQAYTDFLSSVVKVMSSLAFFMRAFPDQFEIQGEALVGIAVRVLQDLPPMTISVRKELFTVFRFLFSSGPPAHKKAALPYLEKLFDDRIVLGPAMGSQENIRMTAYGVIADLVHYIRSDLSASQLMRACSIFLGHLHNPYLTNQLHILSAKVIYNLVEHIVAKETPQVASKLLTNLLESSVDRLESMVVVHAEVVARAERLKKGEDDAVDIAFIERSRPIANAIYTSEKPEDAIAEYRLVFRTLLHGFRHILTGLKKCDAPVPDGTIIARLFDGCVRCMALFDGETRDWNDAMEWLGGILSETNLHVFQEVWTQKVAFVFEAAQKRPSLTQIAQSLFTRELTSPSLVSIVLRYLIGKLPELGDYDDQTAAVTIRMYKMVFGAVGLYPGANEPILASHLGKLVMDCFPLAAKSSKPTNYFHLLRALFRAIGGGGGRFELIYKEVLPLLPEMLECLNRQLLASEGLTRDMIVELCLTVPLRLTHLLPYLTYLMQPLALALRGSPELVSQGLRTLELCIDNLIPDFLDPTLNTVLRELMEALHSHLKPLPASHHHSHTTIRILGKLGGRNRSLLYKEPAMKYHDYSETAKVRLSFGSSAGYLELGPVSTLASRTLTMGKSGAPYRLFAYDYLRQCLTLLLIEGVNSRDREQLMVRCLEGVFDAIHAPELQDQSFECAREFSYYILTFEVRRLSKDTSIRRYPSAIFSCFLDSLPHGLSRDNPAEAKRTEELMSSLLHDLSSMKGLSDAGPTDVLNVLHHVATRFCAMCLEESTTRKKTGCTGIRLLTEIPELGTRWITDRIVDVLRTLLHVLKAMPYDLPQEVDTVYDILVKVMRVSSHDLATADEAALTSKNKLIAISGILFAELSSSNPIVRRVAQKCIDLLVELSGKTTVELLVPHRERMLTAIYTKPLRALPFNIQIGMIEAVRYCLSTHPPLPELNDELLRLLHEALALADADDTALLGRGNLRQGSLEIVKLRVACIKLLTASMPLTDFFSKQPQTRQRVTSVYFKSLYSPTLEVKEVAHEGMRMVLTHQSRLPKELLQTGLRPILLNLSDSKKLSIPGLEGLARLLELLTNYFKVEIGNKLLDHFRIVADPQTLQASSKLPVTENENITKLVRLANIFHLLPPAAHVFLENLVNAIVQTESHMHFSGQSPFSEPLAKYLDRYPVEAIDFFIRHLHFPRHVRTFRSILQAKLAPNLLRELVSRTSIIVSGCLERRDPALLLPGLMLCSDLADLVPGWLTDNPYVVHTLVNLWRIESALQERNSILQSELNQRYSLILSIFVRASEQSPRIDLLFEMVSVFAREQPFDLVRPAQFLYRHVALNDSLMYRRNVLIRFQLWFVNPAITWTQKTHVLRFIVTPTLLIQASKSPKEGLLDQDIVNWIHRHIWIPMNDSTTFSEAGDTFTIELLYLTTAMVHKYPDLLEDAKKDIIKCAWHFITSEDPVVKQTAYLLAARFFEAFPGPQKFILRVWTGLLRPPQVEGKSLIRQALDILAPVLARSQSSEPGFPQWAKTTRRILAEEGSGWSQIILIYQLIIRQPALFYPVRALFVPHIVNYLPKLGLTTGANSDMRLLSIDLLQVIFDWEQQASSAHADEDAVSDDDVGHSATWLTPLAFRESMVSYLVRIAGQDPQPRSGLTTRALSLLKAVISPTNGWTDVNVQLHFFARTLHQNELNSDQALAQAVSAAKVLQVVAAEKDDSWYTENVDILTKLVKKGMVTDDGALLEALHPVFDRLVHLFPLPKEDEELQGPVAEFHSYIHNTVSDGLRNGSNLRGVLLMLKSAVQVTPERVESFSAPLMKLLAIKARDHLQSSPSTPGFEVLVRLLTQILDISQLAVAHLGEQRKFLLQSLVALVEKSKSVTMCRYLLDLARDWALNRREPIPTMKEKATLLGRMTTFELRGERGEVLFNNYLELVYDIYTDTTLRRSDLTVRLEQSFLLGCRSTDARLRERFIDLLDVSVPRSLFSRLSYILGSQSWEPLADHHWIYLALHLLLGSLDGEQSISSERKIGSAPLPVALGRASAMIRPMQRLLFLDSTAAHEAWISIFPAVWSSLSRREQVDINHHMITLLSKDYHINQADLRPNIIQTLLTGALACSPPLTLPPHLVKYLAKNFGAWHVAIELLQASLDHVREDELIVRETVFDSLAEVYAELGEEDMFYGLWRRRSLHTETSEALSYEQIGMWEQAENLYETAQSKARAGIIPFSEPEYCLWEDHWILAAEKLQQWDTLYELARSENNHELLLESAWRIKDWPENWESLEEQISQLPDVATPRRRVFEAFISLLKTSSATERDKNNTDFTRLLEDAMQLSLRKWITLPPQLTHAHVPLLQHFQQFVELQEAVQIFGSLTTTTAANLEKKSQDLKMVLQAWRERLPEQSDDISIWSDLVAWRQNVFNAINKAYIPLITPNQGGAAAGSTNTYGYRGYHETAWIINRFAHVARKHDLLDVCFNSLNKIYTLPNIEISEAFLKLREQARCHYQKPGDLQAGLEVINNTNLMYFSTNQKAEFYTLKGMFHAKFGRNEEANQAFGQAVQLDMTQAKAWASWGRFNDRMFKEHPTEMSHAASAVSCYLQAAGLYKNHKSRPLLVRVLWLLSVDDNQFTISRNFDTYKGDAAFWYWITLIPQLCLSISQREVKQARYILLNLAKLYPQALFFPLRTTREEMMLLKRQAAATPRAQSQSHSASGTPGEVKRDPDHPMQDAESASDVKPNVTEDANGTAHAVHTAVSNPMRQSWDYVEEVVQILKTAFPLLIMSMETIVEQIGARFKASPEEDYYRFVCMLLQDAVHQYVLRMAVIDDDGSLSPQTVASLTRLASNLAGQARRDYDEDFLKTKLSLHDYIRRLQQWRDKYEKQLDSRPRIQSLDMLSHFLTDFQYNKFDEIEVPGQYTEDKNTNQNFVRIQKFDPKFENCRSHGYCWRRITIHGNDNSKTSFAVQLPSGRHTRREERVMQLFRTFNGVLYRKKESRKRNLRFHIPAAVCCGPSLRLLENDSSYITLFDIYEQHCKSNGLTTEDAIFLVGEKARIALRDFRQNNQRNPSKGEYLTLKKELFDEVTAKIAPEDVVTRYMIRTMDSPSELWLMRKQFALQVATASFMTFILCLTSRVPARFHISRTTGLIAMSEMIPGMLNNAPIFGSNDAVPFRLTPNMQHFIGPIYLEGLMTAGLVSVARSLTDPEYELDQQLCLFARDEVMTWLHTRREPWATSDISFRNKVAACIDGVVKRAEIAACSVAREQAQTQGAIGPNSIPVLKLATDLISTATNPILLLKMTEMFTPWF